MKRNYQTLSELRDELRTSVTTLCDHVAKDRFAAAAKEAKRIRKLLETMEEKREWGAEQRRLVAVVPAVQFTKELDDRLGDEYGDNPMDGPGISWEDAH